MRFALLIITDSPVRQIKRLVDKMNTGNFDFYIHVDKGIDQDTYKELFDTPNVYFVKNRVHVRWAGYTTQQAIFNGIKEIVASNREYAFINLLSGQDYPIKSAGHIEQFLKENVGKQFIKCWSFDDDWQEANRRVNRYHFVNLSFKGKYRVEQLINLFVKRNPKPQNLKFYGSNSTFWTLSPDCAMYVVTYVETNESLLRFLKFSWGTDEFVMQTVIMNSHYSDQVVNNNYRYIDWSAGGVKPKTLTVADFDRIVASSDIFGGKFNIEVDEKVLDLIDAANKTADSIANI
ncbi:hypothetical protein EOD41_07645 [Mucilaginibacter limnophilus]|uniref:Peptide O-xylosyltransferase n=1 Tax=Mucilaginibacter limnophilus TaxID=1932778 RepID=A0A3S2V9B4_9SPHI|nr:beta-1,6-N-acetylglucosaminyltransferase [Mucilaginibacter limnophilus]RVU01821.1 hypothetical protein EOD41_07645 [Mucilaginibacter limnophilus]